MVCRNDPDDPRKCDRCGAFLWVADEGLYCGECGVVMPCTMRLLPPPPTSGDTAVRAGAHDPGRPGASELAAPGPDRVDGRRPT